jgi:hypothetical protein
MALHAQVNQVLRGIVSPGTAALYVVNLSFSPPAAVFTVFFAGGGYRLAVNDSAGFVEHKNLPDHG